MNSAVYIFGELSSGYIQYPEDSSRLVLNAVYIRCKAATQIAIRRDGDLMYYCYVRKLNDGHYIGFCLIVNGYYISSINRLFPIFEEAIEKLAHQGDLIHYAFDGQIVTTANVTFKQKEEDIDVISHYLRESFDKLRPQRKLPPVNFSVSKDSVQSFDEKADTKEIDRSTYTYGYTFIYKEKDYDTVKCLNYRAVLNTVNKRNEQLVKRNAELEEQIRKILRQKKQWKWILVSIVAILLIAIVAYNLWGNLLSTKKNLGNAYEIIAHKDDSIKSQGKHIEEQGTQIELLNSDVSRKQRSIKLLADSLNRVNELATLKDDTIESQRILIRNQVQKINSLADSYQTVATEVQKINSLVDSYQNVVAELPLLISKIEIGNMYKGGNVETTYGNTLYQSHTMYLTPRITYVAIATTTVTLLIKLYDSKGKLSTGTSSPSGYSFSRKINIKQGENVQVLNGWGGEKKGHWPSGSYRIEIWYNNICIKSKTFNVADG